VRNYPQSRGAFTLIELMVSMAVVGLFMVVLLSATSTGLGLWRSTESRIDTDREGRAAWLILSQDLDNILVPTNPASQPVIAASPNNTNAPTPLRFLVRRTRDYQTNSSDLGDACYVEYRYSNYALWRGFVGSDDTFDALPSLPTVPDSQVELLATNVPQFAVFATGRDPASSINAGNPLASIEARMEVLDSKDMANFTNTTDGFRAISDQQGYRSRRYYFSRHAVPQAR